MLAPEIWDFEAPNSLTQIKKQETKDCFETIQKFHYNHLVSVVLPNTVRTPDLIQNLLKTDCQYYKVCNLSLEELVESNFINHFVCKGAFSALSIDKRIDTDDCVCVTVDGLMILSLCKETYEIFGLEGTASYYHQKSKERYIVRINLINLKSGTKNYEKTKQCLNRLKDITLIVTWEPTREDVCPSSVAKYFFDLNYDVKLCLPNLEMRTNYCIKVPDLVNIEEFAEWLGMFSLEIDSGNLDSYLTTYNTPTPFKEYGQINFLQSSGFFSCGSIKKLVKVLMDIARSENIPWVSLYVQGFSDSAVGWNGEEHHFHTNGDNSYLIIIAGDNYWITSHACSKKCYK